MTSLRISAWQVLIFVILFAHGCSTSELQRTDSKKTLSQTIDQIQSSIVQISISATHLSPALAKQVGQQWFLYLAIGTGFVVSADGYILTANHVVRDGYEVVKKLAAKEADLLVAFPWGTKDADPYMSGNFDAFKI